MRNSLRWSLPVVLAVSSVSFAQQVQVQMGPAPQQPAAGGPAVNPDTLYGKESAQGVYVRDSAVALEKFAQAQRMERLKEWAKAADLYQEVLEKFADRVVPSQVDKDNNIYQYISVIAAVQQKMSKWPAEGLEVYRQRYEAAAQAIMDGAKVDDRTAMQQVLNRYFPTETAKAAGMRLMDLYLESGEFAAAAWMGEQLLSGHPNLIVERPKVLYRCALAYHLAGDEDRSKAKADELAKNYPNETGTIRGVDVKLVDSLAAEISQGVVQATTIADTSWPQFGGSNDHARISTAAGRPGAKIQSIELSKPNYNSTPNREMASQLKAADQADQDSGATLGVMPVIDRGELFFQDGMKLYAVSIDGLLPLPGWLQTYPGDRKGQYQLAGASRYTPRGQLLGVTLTDSNVLAIMGQSDRRALQFGMAAPAQGEGRLVCLDRATGKEKWVVHPRTLPDEAQALRSADLTGTPLVVDNNVYITARNGRGNQQFEDCYVICFDLDSGKYKWNCYVASANSLANQMMMIDGEFPAMGETTAQLAYSSGRLYVQTNLGALAAVDAYGGRIVWLSIYPRDPAVAANNPMMGRRWNGTVAGQGSQTDKPWESNPVIVDNGRVFILPNDGRFIHVYDAGSGVEIKRMDVKHFDNANCLLAVMGPKMVLTGKKQLSYLNWEKYNIDTFVPKKLDPSIEGIKSLPWDIRGRSFIAGDMVVVPTEQKMYVVQLRTVKVVQEYPQHPKTWDHDDSEGPGNVLVSDDHVIIAANRRIDVYTDMDAARRKLDAKIAANPKAPEPLLEYAEAMFIAGDVPGALEKLDAATQLLGGSGNMQSGPARDRQFRDCVDFAARLSRDIKDKNSDNVKVVEGLYDRAAVAAANPSQQVNFRMMRAQLENTLGDYPQAVKLYQEVIADASMRTVPAMDDQTNVQSASGIVARKAIDAIIRARGAAPYAVFDQQAAAELEKAKATGSADDLVNVATMYPNSKVAPQALLAAADVRDNGGDARGAVQLLRQLYLTYPNFNEKRRVLESLARNYLAMPNRTSVAIARLSEAAKAAPNEKLAKPLLLPNGQQIADVTLSQALSQLKQLRGQEVARTLPDFKLPAPTYVDDKGHKAQRKPFAPEAPDSVISDVTALLSPNRESARPDRLAYYANGTVSIIAPGETKALATFATPDQPAGFVWTSAGPLIWTSTQATLLRGDTNATAWTFDTKALVSVEVVAAVPTSGDNNDTDQPPPNNNPQGDEVFVNGNIRQQIIMNQRGGRRMIIVNGAIRELPAPDPVAGKAVVGGNETIVSARPVGDFVLFTTSSGRIVAVELASGQIRWQTRVAERLPERIAADDDFTVLFQRDDASVTITVLDSFSGQTVGRRVFSPENGRLPFNFALSPDGTLVYTLMDRIVLKNLYEPWTAQDREIVDAKATQTGNPPYMMATMPDQLQVVDGRVLIVADQGTMLRVFSMETGKPVRYTPDGGKEMDMVLPTKARANEQVQLKYVGSQVYLIGPRTLMSYNLDRPDQCWSMYVNDNQSVEVTTDSFVGRNHLVLIKDTKKKINAGQVAGYRLLAYARYPIGDNNSGEAGRCDYDTLIKDPMGVKTVQAVEGGFYYLSADQKLHFLKSNPAN